jgi:DNA repair photolyase
MIAAFSLPLFRLDPPTEAAPRLPRVERVARRSPLLHPTPLGTEGEVLGLNLAQGCAHRCAFCTARAYASYPGDDVVLLPEDTAERLATELAARRQKPRAVYLSPATDPFMPLAEVQTETARVVEVLAKHGVEAWLMTRGYIRPAALEVLIAHKEHVKVTVGLTTLDRALQRVLEPLAAPPALRLRQIATLRERGIRVQVELAPLLPGLTDTRANLRPLLEALSKVGVRHVMAGYLFLRPGIEENLSKALAAHGWQDVLDEYTQGPMMHSAGVAAARYLPKTRRQRGYAALIALAAEFGMRVSVCGVTNPDFGRPRPTVAPAPRLRLATLAGAWGK